MNDDNTTIADILPSFYWPENAVVIVTVCGHRHVRPKRASTTIGDAFLCPFCADADPAYVAYLNGEQPDPRD